MIPALKKYFIILYEVTLMVLPLLVGSGFRLAKEDGMKKFSQDPEFLRENHKIWFYLEQKVGGCLIALTLLLSYDNSPG